MIEVPEAPTGTDTDLDDLDLLDDQYKHALCRHCTRTPPGVPFTALCGRRAVGLTGVELPAHVLTSELLAMVCPDCLERLRLAAPCRLCGRA